MIKDLRLKIFIFGLWVMGIFTHHSSLITSVHAQTVDPNIWQQNAVGLKLQTISIKKYDNSTITEKKTAGLSVILTDKSWPFLSLQGGVADSGYGKNTGPVGIDLGLVKNNTTTTPSVSAESADWAHNEVTFTDPTSGQLKVTVSRLSSAALINSTTNLLRLFAGNVVWYNNYDVPPNINLKEAPSYPKYIAYSQGGTVQVRPLSSTPISLPPLDNNWVLVWYGTNSHFYDTTVPIPYPFPIQRGCCNGFTSTSAKNQAYQADAPVLLTFQNNPTGVAHSPEGGIDLNFSSSAGNVSVMPILGREHPKASDTESWGTSTSLPQTVKDKVNFWAQRLCQYPITASESYKYDSPSDTSTITEDITFTPVCTHSSTKFSIIPPMLSVAKDAFGANLKFTDTSNPPVNITPTNGNLPTEFGPTLGVDNATSYSWSLKGLNKYVSYQRQTGSGQVPQELLDKLISEVDKITTDGHYAPWLFNDRYHATVVGDAYWHNPADTIWQLTEIIPVLPEPQKTNLTNYLKSERANFPPETVFSLSLTQGKERGFYSLPANASGAGGNIATNWTSWRTETFYKRVPLYSFYSLNKYYDLTGEPVSSTVSAALKTALSSDMSEQDFATLYWFKGYPEARKKKVVQMSNKHFQGLLGVINLSKKTGDSTTENLARALLTKSAVFKIASAKYPAYLYNNNLATLPTDPAWQPKQVAGNWNGQFPNYNWTQAGDDARQVMYLNQFGLGLFEHNGYMEPFTGFGVDWTSDGLTGSKLALLNTVPELWSLLSDYAKAETENYIKKVEAIMPNWYVAFGDSILGAEHNLNHPDDSYNIFMGKVYLQNETPQNLEKYLDIPWLQSGDLFYVQKLAETARVYAATNSPSPSPSPIPGDIVPNNRVDIFDYNQLLSDFGKTGPGLISDIVKNDRVDIFDYNLLLTNFGKSIP